MSDIQQTQSGNVIFIRLRNLPNPTRRVQDFGFPELNMIGSTLLTEAIRSQMALDGIGPVTVQCAGSLNNALFIVTFPDGKLPDYPRPAVDQVKALFERVGLLPLASVWYSDTEGGAIMAAHHGLGFDDEQFDLDEFKRHTNIERAVIDEARQERAAEAREFERLITLQALG